MEYTTLTELSAAFKSGELDSTYHLVIDKGGQSLSLRQDGTDEDEDERFEHCESLFCVPDYEGAFEELCALAGIPAERC